MLLAQTDTGSYPVHKTKFRLDEVVKEIFEDINILVESRPVNVKLAYCQPVEVLADKQLIYRLFLNLCDNALKYTEQGFIELSLKSWSEIIEFKIKDTGCGIPPEQLPHIFDRFYRVDKSRTSSTGGSGLGLSISQWIAHAHGGEIYVESEINRGTTVKIHLPLQKS